MAGDLVLASLLGALETELGVRASGARISRGIVQMELGTGVDLRLGSTDANAPSSRIYLGVSAMPGSRAAMQLGPALGRLIHGVERVERPLLQEFRKVSPYLVSELAVDPAPATKWVRDHVRLVADKIVPLVSAPVRQPASQAPLQAPTPRAIQVNPKPQPPGTAPFTFVRPGGSSGPAVAAIPTPNPSRPIRVDTQTEALRARVAELEIALRSREAGLASDMARLEADARTASDEALRLRADLDVARGETLRLQEELLRQTNHVEGLRLERDRLAADLARAQEAGADRDSERAVAVDRLAKLLEEAQHLQVDERARADAAIEAARTAEARIADLEAERRAEPEPVVATAGSEVSQAAVESIIDIFIGTDPNLAIRAVRTALDSIGPWPGAVLRLASALAAVGRYDEAMGQFAALEPATLNGEASGWAVLASVGGGHTPSEALVAKVDWRRGPFFDRLLELQIGLDIGMLLDLTDALGHVLDEAALAPWFDRLKSRTLPTKDRINVTKHWLDASPRQAARYLEEALHDGVLVIDDDGVPELIMRAVPHLEDGRRPELVSRLVEYRATRRDVDGLLALLALAKVSLHVDQAAAAVTSIVRYATGLVPASAPDELIGYAVENAEWYLGGQNLEDAAQVAGYLKSLRDRSSPDGVELIDACLAAVDAAVGSSDTLKKYLELRDREANDDLRRAIAGHRLIFVGATQPAWYDEVRRELGWASDSQWYASSRHQKPPLRPIEATIRAGQVSAIVLFKSHIGHAASSPVRELAKSNDVRLIAPESPSRDALITALRSAFVEPSQGVSSLALPDSRR